MAVIGVSASLQFGKWVIKGYYSGILVYEKFYNESDGEKILEVFVWEWCACEGAPNVYATHL